MAFYATRYRARYQAFFIEQRSKIYESLNKNIFEKITKYGEVESSYTSPIDILKIRYELSELQENSDYEEAKAHWEQDLKNAKPEDMEVQVTDVNHDIEEFFGITAHHIIATAVKTAHFMVFESVTAVPPLNYVSVPGIIKQLERDWIEKTGVDMGYDDNTCGYSLEGSIIATIEKQQKAKLDYIINSLRSEDSQINSAIKSFKLRRNSILKEIKQMNKEINNSIINPIKTGRYRTTCDKCHDIAIPPMP
jgi:hypothetical protein